MVIDSLEMCKKELLVGLGYALTRTIRSVIGRSAEETGDKQVDVL